MIPNRDPVQQEPRRGRNGHRVVVSRATRRRGEALEAAILEAAWEELLEVGYLNLTMEGVAKRAVTSRPVIHRRWQNRPELVIAAMRHNAPALSIEVEDTGSLRGDLLALLRHMSARIGVMSGVISFLIADYFESTGMSLADLREKALESAPGASSMEVILQRAVERGELDTESLTPRIIALPTDLVRHDLIMNQAPPSDETLVEIVDRIFLPLVLRR